jgi:hypothetical protein
MNSNLKADVMAFREKAAEAHGKSVMFYSTIGCILYGFLGATNWGLWWLLLVPAVWLWTAAISAIPAVFMIKSVALRKEDWLFWLSGTVMTLRPLWLIGLTWVFLDALSIGVHRASVEL